MSYTNPGVTDFKDYFARDFPYGPTVASVMDADIQKAETDAACFINEDLFASQGIYTIGFLNLSAHYLCINLQASSQGVSGQYAFLQASKGVGSVSESFNIPQRILDNPELSMLTKTSYGSKFLFMILPQLSGQMFVTYGRTTP